MGMYKISPVFKRLVNYKSLNAALHLGFRGEQTSQLQAGIRRALTDGKLLRERGLMADVFLRSILKVAADNSKEIFYDNYNPCSKKTLSSKEAEQLVAWRIFGKDNPAVYEALGIDLPTRNRTPLSGGEYFYNNFYNKMGNDNSGKELNVDVLSSLLDNDIKTLFDQAVKERVSGSSIKNAVNIAPAIERLATLEEYHLGRYLDVFCHYGVKLSSFLERPINYVCDNITNLILTNIKDAFKSLIEEAPLNSKKEKFLIEKLPLMFAVAFPEVIAKIVNERISSKKFFSSDGTTVPFGSPRLH